MVTNEEIIDYYDFSTFDYQLYAGSRTDVAMRYGLWDETTKNHKEALANENKILAAIARITPQDVVIDLGCGYGFGSVWLAKHIGCRVTGITLSEKQVRFSQNVAAKRGVEKLTEFVVGNFNKMHFPSKSFSVAFVVESICCSENKKETLAEIFRVLKKGGRVAIADRFFKKDPATLTELEKEIARKCFEGVHVPPISRREDFERYLKDAGFTNVAFFDKTPVILPTALYINRFGRAFYPLAKMLGWLKVRVLQASHMEAFINQYPAFRDGIGVYGIFYAEKS